MCQPTTATANKTGWTVRYDHRAEANWILCPAVHGCKFSGWSAGVVGRLLTKGMAWPGVTDGISPNTVFFVTALHEYRLAVLMRRYG